MKGKPKKTHREKDLTQRYLSGGVDEDRLESSERFTDRNKHRQENKTLKTAIMRLAAEDISIDIDALPIGQVTLVHSLFSQVEFEKKIYLCVVRKTLSKVSDTSIVVGDLVRFRDGGTVDESGRPEAVIEQILPRKTILTRADSFKQLSQHPIVANADQMLIVVSLKLPDVKWGLVDRMIIAAQSGGLVPLVCLNKIDLSESASEESKFAREVLAHYQSIGILTLQTSVSHTLGLEALRNWLQNRNTVLAGHSGVGKSSLIRAIQPHLDLRIGEISGYTGKGRHTTTSARRYTLDFGGQVIDTPGVKLFGLWNITSENLLQYFPDVELNTAPAWRKESFERIVESMKR